MKPDRAWVRLGSGRDSDIERKLARGTTSDRRQGGYQIQSGPGAGSA